MCHIPSVNLHDERMSSIKVILLPSGICAVSSLTETEQKVILSEMFKEIKVTGQV